MKLNKRKLQIAMAERGKGALDLESISARTYYRAAAGESICLKSAGSLARELGVRVADIVEIEDRR